MSDMQFIIKIRNLAIKLIWLAIQKHCCVSNSMLVFYKFLLGVTEEGKRHKHCTASTVFRSADWHFPGHPHFFIDLRGRYYSQTSHLELLCRKMPEVPRAGSKCSPLSEVHSERRKDRGNRAVQWTELERGAKRDGKERGTTTKNVCMMVSCHSVSKVTSLGTPFVPYSQPLWYRFSGSYFWSMLTTTE